MVAEFKTNKTISIDDDFFLKKAELEEFQVSYTIYKKFNPYFRFSWEQHINVISSANNCFWIFHNQKRVGGVLIASNSISGLFLIPPYIDIFLIIEALSKHLLKTSNEIYAYSVQPLHMRAFTNNHYEVTNQQVCMIRPTEFVDLVYSNKYIYERVDQKDISKIYSLIQEDYYTTEDLSTSDLVKKVKTEIDWYFKNQGDISFCKIASTTIKDKETNEIIAVCLISMWEEYPLIYHIATKKLYQKQGLARTMIYYALNALKKDYTYMRLFVTVGNRAQGFYQNLGFTEGDIVSDLRLINKEE